MKILSIKPIAILICCLFFLTKANAADWGLKQEITIVNNGDKTTDAVILVELAGDNFDYSKAKAAGADIRFATGKKLGGDGLNYWIEQWNVNGVSKIWIKIPDLKAKSKQTIYMFYNNPSAQAISSGDKTFLFFDDFENGDFTKKWTNTSIGEVAEKDGVLKLKESDGQDGVITANFTITGKMIVRSLYQRGGGDQHWTRAGIGGWNNWLCFGDHTDFAGTGTNYVMLYDSESINSLKTAPKVKVPNKTITDKWRPVAYWFDGTTLKGRQDDIIAGLPMPNASSKLTLRTLDNDEWDNFAFITVSPYADVTVTLVK